MPTKLPGKKSWGSGNKYNKKNNEGSMKKVLASILFMSVIFVVGCTSNAYVLKQNDTISPNSGIAVLSFKYNYRDLEDGSEKEFDKNNMVLFIKDTKTDKVYYSMNRLSGKTDYFHLPEGEYKISGFTGVTQYQKADFYFGEPKYEKMYSYKFTIEKGKVTYWGHIRPYLVYEKKVYGIKEYTSVGLMKIEVLDKSDEDLNDFKKDYPKFSNMPVIKKLGVKL
jgi:hypothetical protein